VAWDVPLARDGAAPYPQCKIRAVSPASRRRSFEYSRGATRRAFLRALAAAVAATGALPALPLPPGAGRWSAWAARLTASDGYRLSPPHEPRHPVTAVGAVWASVAPTAGLPEVRASADGVTWTPWHPLPLDADGAGAPHSSLLFLPASRVVQYRLPPGVPEPRLALIDSSDGPTLADIRRDAGRGLHLLGAAAGPVDDPSVSTIGPATDAPGPAASAGGELPGLPAGQTVPPGVGAPGLSTELPAGTGSGTAGAPAGAGRPAGGVPGQAAARPPIVARAAWGADEANRWWLPEYRVIHHLALHHTGASSGGADPAAAVRSIYHYHAVVLDWGDVGYHYLVDWAGNVYEGRYGGPHVVGGHIRGHNPGVEGIGALGNYDSAWPSDGLLQALRGLLAWRCESLGLDPQAAADLDGLLTPTILGHRDASQTNCPGLRLYLDLPTLRLETGQRLGYTPRLAAEIVGARVAADAAEVGERVAVALTVRNTGTLPLPATNPPPGLGYVEGAGAAARGLVASPGAVQIALGTAEEVAAAQAAAARAQARRPSPEDSAEDAPDPAGDAAARLRSYPYRWGLARDLPPGETATVTAYLRLRGLGTRRLAAAVIREAGDPLAETAAALAVTVVPAPATLRLAVPADSLSPFAPGAAATTLNGAIQPGSPLGMPGVAATPGASSVSGSAVGQPAQPASATGAGSSVAAGGGPPAGLAAAGGPLAGLAASPALAAGGQAGVEQPASQLLLPVFGSADGWTSAVEVRNAGTAPVAVRLRWTPYGGGPAWEDRLTLAANAAITLPRPEGPALPTSTLGAAVLTAEGGVVAATVHLRRGDATALAYAAPARRGR
jgi:hypothetical protein